MPPKKKKQSGGKMIMADPRLARQLVPIRQLNQQGEGFFGDLWSGIKSVGRKVYDVAKDTKLISTGLSFIPDPRAQIASKVAAQAGFGVTKGGKKVTVRKLIKHD